MSERFLSSDEYDETAHQLYNEGRYDEALGILREGLGRQARLHGLRITQTGPVQLPFLTFKADVAAGTFERANVFTGEAARRGVWLHPWHNWFLSAAHTEVPSPAAMSIPRWPDQ